MSMMRSARSKRHLDSKSSSAAKRAKPSIYDSDDSSDENMTDSELHAVLGVKRLNMEEDSSSSATSDGDSSQDERRREPEPKRRRTNIQDRDVSELDVNGNVAGEATEATLRLILHKLDEVMAMMSEQKIMMQKLMAATMKEDDFELFDEFFPEPMDTVKDLNDLCHKLDNDETYFKKMIYHLRKLGGSTPKQMLRTMIDKIATNRVWGTYSLRGMRGKKQLIGMSICTVFIKACMKSHGSTTQKVVETQIGEIIKEAPYRKGGAKYVPPAKEAEPDTVNMCLSSDDSDIED